MRHAALLLLAAAACADAPVVPPATAAAPFRDVRTVALVHWAERPEELRARDPVDAIGESLVARGVVTRAVEAGPATRQPVPELDHLYWQVRERVAAGAPAAPHGRMVDRLGGSVAPILDRLRADAVALSFRFDPRLGPPANVPPVPGAMPPLAGPYGPYGAVGPPVRPLGAVAMVARDGSLLFFEWSARRDLRDPGPVNAAEAVDRLIRAVSGEPEPDEEEAP